LDKDQIPLTVRKPLEQLEKAFRDGSAVMLPLDVALRLANLANIAKAFHEARKTQRRVKAGTVVCP